MIYSNRKIEYILSLVLIVVFILFYVVYNSIIGWTKENIFFFIYAFSISAIEILFFYYFSKYIVDKNPKIIYLENELFRLYINAEIAGTITKLKNYYLHRNRIKYLAKINKILSIENLVLDESKIDNWFNISNNQGISKYNFKFLKVYKLNKWYEKYNLNFSAEYESLYRLVHNKTLIAEPKFPFFSVLLPLLLSIVCFLVSIFQIFSDFSITNLPNYLSPIIPCIIYFLMLAFYSKDSMINQKSKEIEIIIAEIKNNCF